MEYVRTYVHKAYQTIGHSTVATTQSCTNKCTYIHTYNACTYISQVRVVMSELTRGSQLRACGLGRSMLWLLVSLISMEKSSRCSRCSHNESLIGSYANTTHVAKADLGHKTRTLHLPSLPCPQSTMNQSITAENHSVIHINALAMNHRLKKRTHMP